MILSTGAEAVIERKENIVLKKRVPKKYRLEQIDNTLRKQRTRKEANILRKVNEMLPSPKLISVSDERMEIEMEFLNGKKARDVFSPEIAYEIGKIVGKLHSHDIIHGDLTTSNFVFSGTLVYVLDFGLSTISLKPEDKAVDLHLLSQALESKHHKMHKECWQKVVKGYKEENKEWKIVFERLEKVEKRGRNK